MEPVLLRKLNDFITAYSGVTCPLTNVKYIVTCGLLESTHSTCICGSPDGACIMTMQDGKQNAGQPYSVRAAIEMKYLSSTNTSELNRELLADGVVERLQFVDVTDVGNASFYSSVRSPAHRGQCLYHCLVLGVEWCMYVIGDDECVNRVVAIHFDAHLITTLRDFLVTSYKKYMYMFDSPSNIPERWRSEDLGWVGTLDNLRYVALYDCICAYS
jgi:hypothetical protein